MKAMTIEKIAPLAENPRPLALVQLPVPQPRSNEILVRVQACGVCHTELDEIEGRTPPLKLPMVPGHQVVGRIDALGADCRRHRIGERVGVAWIFSACGHCRFCRDGKDNLCSDFQATGRDANGGYAEYMCVKEDFAFVLPDGFSPIKAAPLLCAGAIGYRSLRLCDLKDGHRLGLTGFGASAHLVLKMVRHQYPRSQVYVFARSGGERAFARQLGAAWAGPTEATAPQALDAIIDTTPAWKPVVSALANLKPAGRLIINAIRKETRDQDELLRLDYGRHLWMEKEIKSVANVARRDVSEFLALAAQIPIHPETQTYTLEQANEALLDLRHRKIRGAKVLAIDSCKGDDIGAP